MGPKVVYLAERNATLTGDAWNARWREHGELNRARPVWRHIWRYEQNRTIAMPESVAACVPGPCGDAYGGVGEVWYRSVGAREEMRGEPCLAEIQADEVETFGRAVRNFAVLTSEQVRRQSGKAGVKLVIFAFDADDSKERFWESWRECVASAPMQPLLRAASTYVESPALSRSVPAPARGANAEDLAACAGVIELGFGDLRALIEAVSSEGVLAAWRQVAERLAPAAARTALVEETLLYDELEAVDWPVTELLALRRQLRGATA